VGHKNTLLKVISPQNFCHTRDSRTYRHDRYTKQKRQEIEFHKLPDFAEENFEKCIESLFHFLAPFRRNKVFIMFYFPACGGEIKLLSRCGFLRFFNKSIL
jgi:hypothetical protein